MNIINSNNNNSEKKQSKYTKCGYNCSIIAVILTAEIAAYCFEMARMMWPPMNQYALMKTISTVCLMLISYELEMPQRKMLKCLSACEHLDIGRKWKRPTTSTTITTIMIIIISTLCVCVCECWFFFIFDRKIVICQIGWMYVAKQMLFVAHFQHQNKLRCGLSGVEQHTKQKYWTKNEVCEKWMEDV